VPRKPRSEFQSLIIGLNKYSQKYRVALEGTMGIEGNIAKKLRRSRLIDLTSSIRLSKKLKDHSIFNSKGDLECERVVVANYLEGAYVKNPDFKPESYQEDIYLKIPRRHIKDIKVNPKHLTDYRINKVITIWRDKGYLKTYQGYSWWGKSIPNCHQLTLKGFEYLAGFKTPILHGTLIFLKKDGKRLPIASSRHYLTNKTLKAYNKLLNNSDVRLENAQNPHYFVYRRIFSQDSQKGGRIIDSIQRTPAKTRSQITINNQETFEVDFNSCHLQLSYILQKLKIPEELFRDTKKFNSFELKKAGLIMLNTESKSAAAFALVAIFEKVLFKEIQQTLKKNLTRDSYLHLRSHFIEKKLDRSLKLNAQDMSKVGDLVTKRESLLKKCYKLIEEVESQHPLLKNAFFKKSALKLQKMESDLCVEICRRATQRSIPLISVHDSFRGPKVSRSVVLDIISESSLYLFGQPLAFEAIHSI